jgi:hypothetical protein
MPWMLRAPPLERRESPWFWSGRGVPVGAGSCGDGPRDRGTCEGCGPGWYARCGSGGGRWNGEGGEVVRGWGRCCEGAWEEGCWQEEAMGWLLADEEPGAAEAPTAALDAGLGARLMLLPNEGRPLLLPLPSSRVFSASDSYPMPLSPSIPRSLRWADLYACWRFFRPFSMHCDAR